MQDTMMDQSSKQQPQISEMFSKFALAFKTKTIEFFAEEEEVQLEDDLNYTAAAAAAATVIDTIYDDGFDGFALLDSAEEIITDQKVVVIKPDHSNNNNNNTSQLSSPPKHEQTKIPAPILPIERKPIKTHIAKSLISSIFATISSFEASYLQLQAAHVPFNEANVVSGDRAAVSQLRKLYEFKQLYRSLVYGHPKIDGDFSIGSCLDARVQENQSKLRALGIVSDKLQAEIDVKDCEVSGLRQELGKIQKANLKLSNRLSQNPNSSYDVMLTVKVFDSVLHDTYRSIRRFSKLLIGLMKKANWDLDLAANSVYSNIDYAKKGHNRYAFLSYVSLVMFHGFTSEDFGPAISETNARKESSSYMKELQEHVSCNPIESLNINQNSSFSKFCEMKYQELIHPTMESSIFSNLDKNEEVLNLWESLSVFYKAFINMVSSVWTLHKLAFSFDPAVEIFQVEKGVDFSMIYMEDITKRSISSCKSKLKVGFVVVPGFKIGRTVIQSRVYLTGLQCTE